MRIAVLGTGRMGRALVGHLLAARHDVRVYNRTPGHAAELVASGAALATTPADAVRDADVVLSVLFGPAVVREVIVDAGLTIPAGCLWIDVTTVGPADADDFAAWAGARGIRHVHTPVIGSLGPARAGTLGVLLGGEASAVAAARTVADMWSDPDRVYIFDTAAEAAAAKLAVNLGLAVATQGLAEAIRLGESAGLSLETVLRVLEKSPLAGVVAAKGPTLREAGFADAQFTVDALAKDAALAIAACDAPLPALRAAEANLAQHQAVGQGGWDFSVMASRREEEGDVTACIR